MFLAHNSLGYYEGTGLVFLRWNKMMLSWLEQDFIVHSSSLLNYMLVTCLLGLISLFLWLIFAAKLAPAIPHAMQGS